MNSKLHHIQNWEELAQQAQWSVFKLAKLCGVSTKTLERHFICCFGETPKAWLSQKRQHLAITLLRSGKTVKETANILDYKRPEHFSKDFKKYMGDYPTHIDFSSHKLPNCRVLTWNVAF